MIDDLDTPPSADGAGTAIDEIPDEHLRSVIVVLVLARGGHAQRLGDLAAKWSAAPLN